jgi:hypothetical protein
MAVVTRDTFSETEFEFFPVNSELRGEISAEILEVGGVDPNTIISTNQEWVVKVDWFIEGPLVRHMCGSWCLSVQLESVGLGNDYNLPEGGRIEIPMNPCDGEYSYEIRVPAGTIDPEDCGTLYLLAVTLTSKDPCDRPGHIAAYAKGPNVMFYDGPPHGRNGRAPVAA